MARHRDSAVARPAGLEPATVRLEGGCSIQLSYGRVGPYHSRVRALIKRTGLRRNEDVYRPRSAAAEDLFQQIRGARGRVGAYRRFLFGEVVKDAVQGHLRCMGLKVGFHVRDERQSLVFAD